MDCIVNPPILMPVNSSASSSTGSLMQIDLGYCRSVHDGQMVLYAFLNPKTDHVIFDGSKKVIVFAQSTIPKLLLHKQKLAKQHSCMLAAQNFYNRARHLHLDNFKTVILITFAIDGSAHFRTSSRSNTVLRIPSRDL